MIASTADQATGSISALFILGSILVAFVVGGAVLVRSARRSRERGEATPIPAPRPSTPPIGDEP